MLEYDQRIAIAKAVGWAPTDGDVQASKTWEDITGQYIDPSPPDYLHDLNAMHEAEKALNIVSQGEIYYRHLQNLVTYYKETSRWFVPIVMATAAQRAEAFLRTIGKWID